MTCVLYGYYMIISLTPVGTWWSSLAIKHALCIPRILQCYYENLYRPLYFTGTLIDQREWQKIEWNKIKPIPILPLSS